MTSVICVNPAGVAEIFEAPYPLPSSPDSWQALSQIAEFADSRRAEVALSHWGLKFFVWRTVEGKPHQLSQFLSYEALRRRGAEEAMAIIENLLRGFEPDGTAPFPEETEAA